MTARLELALQFNHAEIQAGIDEAETELLQLRDRVDRVEHLIAKARHLLEGGTADISDNGGTSRLTLHEAMRLVLQEQENLPMTARALADEITQRGLYKKRDGSPVEINQVHARVGNYKSMFEKVDSRIRLRRE